MLGATASKLHRVTGLLFRSHHLSHSIPNRSISISRTSFHGINSFRHLHPHIHVSRRVLPLRITAFVSGPGTPAPDGKAWLSSSTAAPENDKTNPRPFVPKKTPAEHVGDVQIFRTLASYLWMKDNYEFRLRVLTALGFLVGAKVLNVQVPFLFKLAVDWLTTASGNAGTLAAFTAANPTQLAIFATPASVLIGYGIARSGASAFNGTTRH